MLSCWLTAHAHKDKANNHGDTPMVVAAGSGHAEVVRLLLEAGADKDKANNRASARQAFSGFLLVRDVAIQLLFYATVSGIYWFCDWG